MVNGSNQTSFTAVTCLHRKLQKTIPSTMGLQKLLLKTGYIIIRTLSNMRVKEALQNYRTTYGKKGKKRRYVASVVYKERG